jgi:hypothetical protein
VHVLSNDQAPTLSRELLVVAAALECVGEPGFKLWALPPHAVLACPDRAYTWWQYVVSVLLYNFSCFYPTLVFVIHVCAVAQLSCYGSALLAPMCCIVFDVGAALYTCGTPSCAKRMGLTGVCAKACCAHAMTPTPDRALGGAWYRDSTEFQIYANPRVLDSAVGLADTPVTSPPPSPPPPSPPLRADRALVASFFLVQRATPTHSITAT